MPFPYIHANGNICCSNPVSPCDRCKAKMAAERLHGAQVPVPDPYAAGLATMRAASSTPESRFAEQYKADRLRALEVEYSKMRTAQKTPITAAELKRYAAPDPYAAGIKALQEEKR